MRSVPIPAQLAAPLQGVELVACETRVGSLWLDADDRLTTPWLLAEGEHQPMVARFLAEHLGPGATFIDVGAHIGYFSVLAARLVGPTGRVVAVEPNPLTAALLRANLWRAGARSAEVLEMAAGDETGHVLLVEHAGARAGAHVEPARGGEGGRLVPCARLDDVLDAPVDVLKCDAERFDHLVVRGLEATIARSPGLVAVVEFFAGAYPDGAEPAEILAYYRALGFELAMFSDGGPVAASDEAILGAAAHHQLIDIILRRPAR